MGGLLQHRQDGADLPPTPMNSSSQDAATKVPVNQDPALEHAEAGVGWAARLGESRFWGAPASVQAGVSWQLHPRGRLWRSQPGKAQAELGHGHCSSLPEMSRLATHTSDNTKAWFSSAAGPRELQIWTAFPHGLHACRN